MQSNPKIRTILALNVNATKLGYIELPPIKHILVAYWQFIETTIRNLVERLKEKI